MNRLQLYFMLRQLEKKSFRRSPAFEQGIAAKVMMAFSGAITVIYLIAFGTFMAIPANEEEMPAMLLVIMPFFLTLDFLARFMMQQIPLMQAKPYFLLPIPRRTVIDYFLLSSSLNGWNALWLALFLPYSIITIAGGADWLTAVSVVLTGMMLVLANSQWYLLVRTLIGRSLFWWALPALVYAAYYAPLFLSDKIRAFDDLLDQLAEYAASPLALLLSLALFAALYTLNRSMQFRMVYDEVAKLEKKNTNPKTVSSLSQLERFGLSGEYLKLEVKSIMRNRAIRSRVIMSLSLVVVLSLLITFTDIYDGRMMLNFWCYYCFAIYGMTSLAKILGPEGNYIDLLVSHKENLYQLLRSKYYFHCAILIVPFVIMLPAVFGGKFSWLMMLAYMTLSSGLLYVLMFQLAVYNKTTLPLDQKLTGKNSMENGLQLVIELTAMFLPLGLVVIMLAFFDETTAYTILFVLGLLLTLAHPLWLMDVYKRMMKRKYQNLEGFHASRA